MVAAAEVCAAPSYCCPEHWEAWFCSAGCAEAEGATRTPEKHCTVAETPGGSAPGWHMKRRRSRKSAGHTKVRYIIDARQAQ